MTTFTNIQPGETVSFTDNFPALTQGQNCCAADWVAKCGNRTITGSRTICIEAQNDSIFRADSMCYDESLIDISRSGIGSCPDVAPLNIVPASATQHPTLITDHDQLVSAIANVTTPTVFSVADGAYTWTVRKTLQGNTAPVYIVPQSPGGVTITGFANDYRGSRIHVQGLIVNNARSQIAYVPEIHINNNIFRSASGNLFVQQKVAGAEGGSYFKVTNNKLSGMSGTPFLAKTVRPSEAGTVSVPKGFTIIANEIEGPYTTSVASIFAGEGWSPTVDESKHVFVKNRITGYKGPGIDDEIVSIKSAGWYVAANMAIDCGAGNFTGRVTERSEVSGNLMIVGAGGGFKPIRMLGPDGIVKYNGVFGSKGNLFPTVYTITNGRGISLRREELRNDPDLEHYYLGSNTGRYENNIFEGNHFATLISLFNGVSPATNPNAFEATGNSAKCNIYWNPPTGSGPSQVRPFDASVAPDIANFQALNPDFLPSNQVRVLGDHQEISPFLDGKKEFDFTPETIVFDSDERACFNTIRIEPPDWMKTSVKMYCDGQQVW